MRHQFVDRAGAADYLGLSLSTVTYRINHHQFPDSDSGEWWDLDILDSYRRSLSAKKAAKTRKRNTVIKRKSVSPRKGKKQDV